jgi:hypothetical protein
MWGKSCSCPCHGRGMILLLCPGTLRHSSSLSPSLQHSPLADIAVPSLCHGQRLLFSQASVRYSHLCVFALLCPALPTFIFAFPAFLCFFLTFTSTTFQRSPLCKQLYPLCRYVPYALAIRPCSQVSHFLGRLAAASYLR